MIIKQVMLLPVAADVLVNGARASRIRSSSEALESRRGDLCVVFPKQGKSWKPDSDGNLIAEQGDNAATLAKFMGVSVSDAESLLQSQGYSTDVEKGSKVMLDNVFRNCFESIQCISYVGYQIYGF